MPEKMVKYRYLKRVLACLLILSLVFIAFIFLFFASPLSFASRLPENGDVWIRVWEHGDIRSYHFLSEELETEQIRGILAKNSFQRSLYTIHTSRRQDGGQTLIFQAEEPAIEINFFCENTAEGMQVHLLGTGEIIVNRRFYGMNYDAQQAMIQGILSVLEISS